MDAAAIKALGKELGADMIGIASAKTLNAFPPDPRWPCLKWGISMLGTGMLTTSRPVRPIISPCVTYLRRFLRTRPRTISRKRLRSRSILRDIRDGTPKT